MNNIAIYSANFGNYRDELKDIDNVFFDEKIDYYFFTDNKNITSKKWNIILSQLNPELYFIDSFRHTSKYFKFVVPEILNRYNIIIWIDNKSLKFLKFSNKNIINLFEKKYSFFILRHPIRKTAQEEIKTTIECTAEHEINGDLFLSKIKDNKFSIDLPDSTCLIYKNTNSNISILQKIYDSLIMNGLRRDQNVIQQVFLENNYELNVSYFTFENLTV